MNKPLISVSAPGSLMLLGEHAVLHGRRALVCAIDKRIAISLSKINKPILRIVSGLGNYEAPLDDLKDHPDLCFVLDAVRQYSPEQGIELNIESEFSSEIGFGSSAAVTVATHAVLMGGVQDKLELFKRSLATIRRVQGRGSGADVAASVFGGVVAYRAEPLEITPLNESFPLTAVYSGSKMKTADVIQIVEERRQTDPEKYERIFDAMDKSVDEVIADFSTLGRQLTLNQQRMEEMGLCNKALSTIIAEFNRKHIPAKISGSGLGDCVIGLGQVSNLGDFPTYSLDVASDGCV